MNSIVIDGRLTAEPEQEVTSTGVECVKFTVANERRKAKEKQSSFFKCQAYGRVGAFVKEYFHKGDPIIVAGEIEIRSYEDKNGVKRTATTLFVEKVHFTLGKGKNAEPVSSDVNTDDLPF